MYNSKRAIEIFNEEYPRGVDLVYVDYRDQLTEEQCQKIIETGNLYDAEESSMDWIADCQWDTMREIIKELAKHEELSDFEDDMVDDDSLRDAIYEADTSNVIKDLLRNTGKVAMYYELDYYSEYGLSEDSLKKEIKSIAKHLKIDAKEHYTTLKELVENATYGGNLCVYWYGDLEDIIHDNEEDFKFISFSSPLHLCIMDRFNGSGHDVTLKAPITAEFNRKNLCMDKAKGQGYSYGYDVCGLYMPSYEDSPTLRNKVEKGVKIVKLEKK